MVLQTRATDLANGIAPLPYRTWPQAQPSDLLLVEDALRSGIWCGDKGHYHRELESAFGRYLDPDDPPLVLSTNGGTNALHLALEALGVEPGQEVIMPALSFAGTPLPALYVGARPRFVDVDADSFNLDVDAVARALGPKTAAVMPVHLHGLPADIAELYGVLEGDYEGVAIVEDACQAHGARYCVDTEHGTTRAVGTFGDFGCFSLNATKAVPAGEGGLMVTRSPDLYERARTSRDFGEPPASAWAVPRRYVSETIGHNYRITEVSAALALGQLRRLDHTNARAAHNAAILSTELLDRHAPVRLPSHGRSRSHTFHKYRVRLDRERLRIENDAHAAVLRDRAIELLAARGVEAVYWQTVPLPCMPAFGGEPLDRYPVAAAILADSFCLFSEARPLCAQDGDVVATAARRIADALTGL